MSRVAKIPIPIPDGTSVEIIEGSVVVKGPNGSLKENFSVNAVLLATNNNEVLVKAVKEEESHSRAMSGTARAIIANMVQGVSVGFEKKLSLVGVGYKAQAKGSVLNLSLGFSHPVDINLPDDIKVVTPTQTEILISGANKQKVGQIASEIRAYRPPEPYKGKGVRYTDEIVIIKETKKK
jgi:large subunit ribosomal protein L6